MFIKKKKKNECTNIKSVNVLYILFINYVLVIYYSLM